MTTSLLPLAQASHDKAPPMLIIIFWILVILWAIGGLELVRPDNPAYVNVNRGRAIVAIILFSILGYYTFGF